LADLFFGVQVVDPAWFVCFVRVDGRVFGLDMRFLGQKRRKNTKATNKCRSPHSTLLRAGSPGMTTGKAKAKAKARVKAKATAKAATTAKAKCGSLRCAVHDTAVNGSGRDDAAF
jgi:hypothetical protein